MKKRECKIKHGNCEICEITNVMIHKFKGDWVCRLCLNPPLQEIHIDEFQGGDCALGEADIWLP